MVNALANHRNNLFNKINSNNIMEIIKEPKLENLQERKVAYVSFIGNYIGNAEIFKNLFDKLCEWAGPLGLIKQDSVFLSAYQDDPNTTPPDELKLEVCLGIKEAIKETEDIKQKTLTGGKHVVMECELSGPEEYGPAWNKVVEWIKENNLEIDMTRQSYEIYKNNPEEHPKKHHIVEIQMPVN
jgi:AraC family transcriptional regulator